MNSTSRRITASCPSLRITTGKASPKGEGRSWKLITPRCCKIQDPAKLYKLIDMIDREQWSTLGADIKGKIYEGLLKKNAEDTKSGAGETVRKKLMETTSLHTILRLPTGVFYKQAGQSECLVL